MITEKRRGSRRPWGSHLGGNRERTAHSALRQPQNFAASLVRLTQRDNDLSDLIPSRIVGRLPQE
jgi:hypothetical protein